MKGQIEKWQIVLLFVGALINLASGQNKFFKEVTLDTRIASQYLAGRAGFVVEDEPVMQNYFDANTPAGTFYWWSNSRIPRRDLSEVDLGWISPSASNDHVGVNLNISTFNFPNCPNGWQNYDFEAGVNIFSKGLPVNTNLYVAGNWANEKSSLISKLSFGENFDFHDFSLGLEGAIVYSDGYYAKNHGFTHGTLKAEISKEVVRGVDVYAGIIGQKELDAKEKVKDDVMGYAGMRIKLK